MKGQGDNRDIWIWARAAGDSLGEETYGLLRRAAVRIPANVAEGQARRGTGEFLQFLGVARGSLAELETLVILCGNLGLFRKESAESVLRDCAEIGRLLSGLVRSLRR